MSKKFGIDLNEMRMEFSFVCFASIINYIMLVLFFDTIIIFFVFGLFLIFSIA